MLMTLFMICMAENSLEKGKDKNSVDKIILILIYPIFKKK